MRIFFFSFQRFIFKYHNSRSLDFIIWQPNLSREWEGSYVYSNPAGTIVRFCLYFRNLALNDGNRQLSEYLVFSLIVSPKLVRVTEIVPKYRHNGVKRGNIWSWCRDRVSNLPDPFIKTLNTCNTIFWKQ